MPNPLGDMSRCFYNDLVSQDAPHLICDEEDPIEEVWSTPEPAPYTAPPSAPRLRVHVPPPRDIPAYYPPEEDAAQDPEPFVHPNGSTTVLGQEHTNLVFPYDNPNYPLAVVDQSLRMWLVTLTYPGGVSDEMRDRLVRYFNEQKMFFLLVREGGDQTNGIHVHYHALIWAPVMRRSDSITRSIRTAVYLVTDTADIRTDHLVRTSAVSNWDQAWSYVLKDMIKYPEVPTMMCHLPRNFDLERLYADCTERELARARTATLFPTEGTKWWEARAVPDNLCAAAAELGIHLPDQFAFANLVQSCYARGIRFDLSKGRYYRLALEMILAKDKPSEILIHELTATFNK